MNRKNKILIGALTLILTISTISFLVFASNDFQTKAELDQSATNLTSVSRVKDGLKLSITLQENKTQYTSGETVPITFTLTNVSNQTINFNQNGDSNFNFQVYNSTNNKVYSRSFDAYAVTNATICLAPGENYTQTFNWQEISFPDFSQVSSGTYYIIGDVGEISPYQLQTSSLKITITVNSGFNRINITCSPAIETSNYANSATNLEYPNGTLFTGWYTHLDFNYTISPLTVNFDYHNLYVVTNGEPVTILSSLSTPLNGSNINFMQFTLPGNMTNYSLTYKGTNIGLTVCQIG